MMSLKIAKREGRCIELCSHRPKLKAKSIFLDKGHVILKLYSQTKEELFVQAFSNNVVFINVHAHFRSFVGVN